MTRLSNERVDAGFERVLAVRRLQRHWAEYRTADYWRRLNPQLTITDRPFACGPPVAVDAAIAQDCREQLLTEGFFASPPLISEARMAPVRRAVIDLVEQGILSGFACLYDEYYHAMEGLGQLVGPILGPAYRWVAHGNWAFYVPPGDPALSGLTASGPHRDSLGPDARVKAGGLPGLLTVWVPLTDVTPTESCIYVIPKSGDPDFLSGEHEVSRHRISLTDVRAVPAAAGSILGWSTHLAHWGSRASLRAAGPRISISMYFQRADEPPFHPSVFDEGGQFPFADRLRWVVDSIGTPDLTRNLDWSEPD